MTRSPRLRLKPNVVMEPLVNHWYVWPYLINPVTYALYLVRQLQVMDSFAKNPDFHRTASRNPIMRGGSFMDFSGDTKIVEALSSSIKSDCGELIEAAAAIKDLSNLLRTETIGQSMEELYRKVPPTLQGFVELTYDLENHPVLRFIEPLLYHSNLYRQDLQSISLRALSDPDERPFVFSTPRPRADGALHLALPFADGLIDRLFRMRTSDADDEILGCIQKRCALSRNEMDLLASLFCDSQDLEATASIAPRVSEVRIRYFGHAAVLMETAHVSVMTDPIVPYTRRGGLDRFTFTDLPDRIDFVLLTHAHQDHVLIETLLQIRHRIGQIVVPKSSGGYLQDPSLRWALTAIGFPDVREIDELERLEVPGGSITGLPFLGEHGDLSIRSKLGFLVDLCGRKVMLVADSNNLDPRLYDRVHACIGDVDLLFIGMECEGAPASWMYGPLFTQPLNRGMDQSRRLNGSDFSKARLIIDRFRPATVAVYAMGSEPWLRYVSSIDYTSASPPIVESEKLIAMCHAQGIECSRLYGRHTYSLESR